MVLLLHGVGYELVPLFIPTCSDSGGYTTRCRNVNPKPCLASGRWMTMVRGAALSGPVDACAAVGGGSASG